MLRQGPIPRVVYGLLQYLLGAFLVAAPFLLSYDSDAAKAASIIAGLVLLTLAAVSQGPTGLSRAVPLAASLVLDVALACIFVAAPFLFGFSHEGSPTAVFIVAGIVLLLLTIATRFQPATDAGEHGRAGRRARRRGSRRDRGADAPAGEVPGTIEPPEWEVPGDAPARPSEQPPRA
jgi:hypothetical protein